MSTNVKLKFVDVLGGPLDDRNVVVDVFSLDNSRHFQAIVPLSGQTEVGIQLEDCPSGFYRLELWPNNYQVVQFFLRLNEDGTTVRKEPVVFPADPSRVVDIAAPVFGALDNKLQQLLAGAKINLNNAPAPQGSALYDALPDILKAALLNLFTKSSHTMLGDGTSCFDHISGLIELDQDRLFAKAEATLLEETMQSKKFHSVDFSLHKDVPPYHVFSSFKTLDTHGNLQLTFSRHGDTGSDYLVDMDIDEAQGIEHAFEVVKNAVTGLTNPYNVREILAVAPQNLTPLYTFKFAARGVAQVAQAGQVAGGF
jgi:hypothetical protein